MLDEKRNIVKKSLELIARGVILLVALGAVLFTGALVSVVIVAGLGELGLGFVAFLFLAYFVVMNICIEIWKRIPSYEYSKANHANAKY
jgi:hypothetical protein